MKKKVKNFFMKVEDPDAIKNLTMFVKLAVVNGVHQDQVLLNLVKKHNKIFMDEHDLQSVRLVDEQELRAGLPGNPSHTTIMKYKRKGMFDDIKGQPSACYANGYRVIYDLDVVKQRIKSYAAK